MVIYTCWFFKDIIFGDFMTILLAIKIFKSCRDVLALNDHRQPVFQSCVYFVFMMFDEITNFEGNMQMMLIAMFDFFITIDLL